VRSTPLSSSEHNNLVVVSEYEVGGEGWECVAEFPNLKTTKPRRALHSEKLFVWAGAPTVTAALRSKRAADDAATTTTAADAATATTVALHCSKRKTTKPRKLTQTNGVPHITKVTDQMES
jgi:hypothetical protein